MKRHDEPLTWRGLHGTRDAVVRVRIFDDMVFIGRTIVLLTEPEDNPGTSVTNGVEWIAPIVCNDHKLNPANVTFVEHYDARSGRPSSPETFDVVTFNGPIEMKYVAGSAIGFGVFRGPSWARMDWEPLRNSIVDGEYFRGPYPPELKNL